MISDTDAVFDTQIALTIGIEGAYSNERTDLGGETIWGVTAFVARAYGYAGAMKDMPRETAVGIYKARYWLSVGFDKIAAIDIPIGTRMLDCGINCGQATAAGFLQRALNVLNNSEKLYPNVTQDGQAGLLTRTALNAFIACRGDAGRRVLYEMIKAQQSVYYIDLAERIPLQETNEYGWQLNRV